MPDWVDTQHCEGKLITFAAVKKENQLNYLPSNYKNY